MGCATCQNVSQGAAVIVPAGSIHKDSQSTVGKEVSNVQSHRPDSNDSKGNYLETMVNEINLVRTQPKDFSNKISKVVNMIHVVDNKNVLIFDDAIQIEIGRGKEAFMSCIQYLNTKAKVVQPLTHINDLVLPFPSETGDLVLSKDYLTNELEKINNKVEGKYSIIDFQYDISPNPIISTLLQVVDDTSSSLKRRKNILNKHAKYIGISYGLMKKNIYCFYLVFAN